jgi:hypothetical protein
MPSCARRARQGQWQICRHVQGLRHALSGPARPAGPAAPAAPVGRSAPPPGRRARDARGAAAGRRHPAAGLRRAPGHPVRAEHLRREPRRRSRRLGARVPGGAGARGARERRYGHSPGLCTPGSAGPPARARGAGGGPRARGAAGVDLLRRLRTGRRRAAARTARDDPLGCRRPARAHLPGRGGGPERAVRRRGQHPHFRRGRGRPRSVPVHRAQGPRPEDRQRDRPATGHLTAPRRRSGAVPAGRIGCPSRAATRSRA